MKSKSILAAFLILMVLISACSNPSTPSVGSESNPRSTDSPAEVEAEPTADDTIGTVSKIRTQVFVGAADNLVPIEDQIDLANNEYVKVQDGGKARLEFPGPISMLLYNLSEMDGINLEYDDNSNPRIKNRLIRGGFFGYVEPGSQLTIDLAFDVQVNVLGTNFFIIFDEEKNYITVGKFDGTLSLSVPGQPTIYLDDQEMIDISSEGVLTHYTQIAFTPAEFDTVVDSCLTASQGLGILRRDTGLPQLGETTVNVNANLICDPQTPDVVTVTGDCERPVAEVKVRKAYLKNGADLRFGSMGEYKEGDEFTVLGHYRGWYNVEMTDGKTGWLYIDWINLPPGTDITRLCNIEYGDLPPTPTPRPVCKPTQYVICP